MGLIGRGPTTKSEAIVSGVLQMLGWLVVGWALIRGDQIAAAGMAAVLLPLAESHGREIFGPRWPRWASVVLFSFSVVLLVILVWLLVRD